MALRIVRVVAALLVLLAAVLSQGAVESGIGSRLRHAFVIRGASWHLGTTAMADNGDSSDNSSSSNNNNGNSGDNGSSSNNNNSDNGSDNGGNSNNSSGDNSAGNNNNSGDNSGSDNNSGDNGGSNNNSGDNGDNSSNGNNNGGDNVSRPATPAPAPAPAAAPAPAPAPAAAPAANPAASTTEASGVSTGGESVIALPGDHVVVHVFPWMPSGVTITVRLIDPSTVPAPPGSRVGDLVFRVEGRGAGGATLSTLPAEVNLSATYADQDVVGLNEPGVTLFWLDPATNQWTPAPKLATDASTNFVSASVTALGTYAVSIP